MPLTHSSAIPDDLRQVFGSGVDAIEAMERRARRAFPSSRLIVWESDPASFAFTYVGGDAEQLLGHPRSAWTDCTTFWIDSVIHPDDRRDAVAFCALATATGFDHLLEYRARHAGGAVVWLLDYVMVAKDALGVPTALRGIMFDISAAKRQQGYFERPPTLRAPAEKALKRAQRKLAPAA